jgi:NAD(P)-dependent dehydrogenase (short-subunit alcohol dehydrogenase family)
MAEQVADRVTERLVIRMLDAPLTGDTKTPVISGAAVILGSNAAAQALQQRLQSQGVAAYRLETSDDPEAAKSALDSIWQEHAITHLFLATPHDADADAGLDPSDLETRKNRGVVVPFVLCQHWLARLRESSLADKAVLYACTALGGDFGISGKVNAVESGGLTGLIKSLRIEARHIGCSDLRLKAIDFASDETPQSIAEAVCNELAGDTPDLEVGIAAGCRRVVRVVPEPLELADERPIARSGNWVITGGARGVTALVAHGLGVRFHLKLNLLGTSPLPQIDSAWRDLSETGLKQLKTTIARQARGSGKSPLQAWTEVEKALEIDRTLRELEEAGVQATYHCCDVTDRAQLSQVLDHIRQADGPIEGVIHGAGITIDAKFPSKKRENIQRTLSTKVDGAAALMALTADDPVQFFVGFGSVAGRFGANGQSDYAAANDMLCKQIDWLRTHRPECTAIGVHWHAWDDAGMAVKPEVKSVFDSMDFALMPSAEGVAHLIRELTTGGSESEVIFTDAQHYREAYPVPIVADVQPVDSTAASRPAAQASADDPAAHLPLIDKVCQLQPGNPLLVESRLDPTAEPFLTEHRMADRPVLPAVIALEMLAEASSLLDGRQVVGFRDVEIHAGLHFNTDDPRIAKIAARVTDGGARCELTSDYYDRRGRLVQADRLAMTATVELAEAPPDLSIPHCGDPSLGWFPMYYSPELPVYHGPPMRDLKDVFCQYDGSFGRIVAPAISKLAGSRRDDGWRISPGVLDACLVACSTFGFVMFEKLGGVPLGFDRLRLANLPRPGEECTVRSYYLGKDDKEVRFNFVLFGEDHRVILAADGYRVSIVRRQRPVIGK